MQRDPSIPHALTALLDAIDPRRMFADTRTLCTPALAGRRVGTEGHQQATNFLVAHFRGSGWHTTIEPFTATTPVLEVSSQPRLEILTPEGIRERALALRTEFCEHPRSAPLPHGKQGRAVGLNTTESLKQTWVILDAVPQGAAFTDLVASLASQGAIGVLTPLYASTHGYLTKRIIAGMAVALPVLSVRADILSTLAGKHISACAPISRQLPTGYNVFATRDGNDTQGSPSPILIGAHYDGVGDDPGGPRLPGATDNAAAVAVVLEIGRLLGRLEFPSHRPVHLAAFDAEEIGAHGSRALADHYQQQGQTPQVINLDGAASLNEAVWVEPGVHTEAMLQALDQAGQWVEIPLVLGNIASDHRQFTAAGFAALGLSVGATGLHTPDDGIQHVQPEALRVAAALILSTIWQLTYAA